MTRLLAKSPKPGVSDKGLIEHSLDVMDAFQALFGTLQRPSRLGECWLRLFRLPQEAWSRFYRHGLVACGLHDPGKANNGFQSALFGKGNQAIRHEHLSALMLGLPQTVSWLEQGGLEPLLLAAVVGAHHLKLSAKEIKGKGGATIHLPFAAKQIPGSDLIRLENATELTELFNGVTERAGLPPWQGTLPEYWSFSGKIGESIPRLRDSLIRSFRGMEREFCPDDSQKACLYRALLAALVAADAAGSGLPRERQDIAVWLAATFGEAALTGDDIRNKIIEPRIAEIEIETGKRRTDPAFKFKWQKFQENADHLPERALLLAGCGAGKTLAAWRWIAARLDERPAARVIFLYPTRAAATEGFRDYVSHAPESDAALLSGTAGYELADMFDNPADERSQRHYATDDRLYALGFWQKRVFASTVDQFLGFLQLAYRSLCLLPVLADAVVVIDEVHSFDHKLWTALQQLLKAFHIPVLCMTASLPAPRREALEALGLAVYPAPGQAFDDLERRAEQPRYRVKKISSESKAMRIARAALAKNRRVLWVTNTVDRCQRLARELAAPAARSQAPAWERSPGSSSFRQAEVPKQALGNQEIQENSTLCYHSRYTLEDRKNRHREVVAAFQPGCADGGVIAVTTQVCEMSLDLDAQVLISELAPIPSLIQRMGRCNRHAVDENSKPGRVYCYTPEASPPYREDEIGQAERFIAELDGTTVSQRSLEELLETYTRDQAGNADAWIAFIEGLPWAAGGEEDLRDAGDYTVSAILDDNENLAAVLELREQRKSIDGYVLPVPHRFAKYDARTAPYRIAPASHYHRNFGFEQEPDYGRQEKTA